MINEQGASRSHARSFDDVGDDRDELGDCDVDGDGGEPMGHHAVAALANASGKASISKRNARRLALKGGLIVR